MRKNPRPKCPKCHQFLLPVRVVIHGGFTISKDFAECRNCKEHVKFGDEVYGRFKKKKKRKKIKIKI